MVAATPPHEEFLQRIQSRVVEWLSRFPDEASIESHPDEDVRSFLHELRNIIGQAEQAASWNEERLMRFADEIELVRVSFLAGHVLAWKAAGQLNEMRAQSCVFKCEEDRKSCADECVGDRWCLAWCNLLMALCLADCFVDSISIG